MSVDLLLKSHLKTLKLPTILQEYPRAARQCAQEDRSFEEFLHYLAELLSPVFLKRRDHVPI